MHKMGPARNAYAAPCGPPQWAGSAAGHCPAHPVLATSSSWPPRYASYGEMKGPGSHGPLCLSPAAPSLTHSRVLWPHPFPAAECPLVVTLEVFEDSEEETELGGWTPRSRTRGQGLPEDKDLLPT